MQNEIPDEILDEFEYGCEHFCHDPYGWVLWAFDWGHGELKDYTGPDEWQEKHLKDIRDKLITPHQAILKAIASGHGIGKTAFIAWIIMWGATTFEDTRGVVTANTEIQLRTKTWSEVGKWHRRYICKDLFKYTATALFSVDPAHEKTWRVDCIPWSEHNPEAFAGLHNHGKRIIVLFDEASNIADSIWETTEGALTDANTEIIWLAFGNPTRNTGRFRECWRKFVRIWSTSSIDSRTAKMSNKEQIQKWIESYGEDSDFVKVRVKGEFPSQSDYQFIANDIVSQARKNHLRKNQYDFAPVIITCDPAWTGGDETIIAMRQGLYSKILAVFTRNEDDVFIAGSIAAFEDQYNADAVFIDLGFGTGIYSAGKNWGRKWQLVSFGEASIRPDCLNKRVEMWQLMKEWLQEGAAIDDDDVLAADLTGPEYRIRLDGKIALESKEDMKDRGLDSPNRADAIALSFARPVVKKKRLPFRPHVEAYNPYKRRR